MVKQKSISERIVELVFVPAIILAIIATLAYSIGFSYYHGYFGFFGIPLEDISLSANGYVPFAIRPILPPLIACVITSVFSGIFLALIMAWDYRFRGNQSSGKRSIQILTGIFYLAMIGCYLYISIYLLISSDLGTPIISACILILITISLSILSLKIPSGLKDIFMNYLKKHNFSNLVWNIWKTLFIALIYAILSFYSFSVGKYRAMSEITSGSQPTEKVTINLDRPIPIPRCHMITLSNSIVAYSCPDLIPIITNDNYHYLYRQSEVEGTRPITYAVPVSSVISLEYQRTE